MALSTARIHRVRGRPPLLAAGIKSLIHSHSSSVRSLGYIFSFIYPFYTTREDFSDRLLDEVLAQRQRERQRLATYHQQQVSHARFAATLARRRYEHVDPAYRLAAAELEREWDDRLRALRQAEEAAERFAHEPGEATLTPELRDQLLHLSQCLPDLWSSPQLSHPQRKALLRSLISRVMVKRIAPDRVEVKIIWVSGHFSEGIVIPPVLHQHHVTGYDTMVERTRQLWAEGYADLHIAAVLSREGFRSARCDRVLAKTVLKM